MRCPTNMVPRRVTHAASEQTLPHRESRMSHRFFVNNPIRSARATLVDSEAHHLIHVMRARPGDEIVLFDGSGAEFSGRVERLTRSEAEVHVVDRREVDLELPFQLTLAVALPKGDRQKWMVEKLVELGTTRLVPLETARGVAQPVNKALLRLRRAVVEASKQCGRNRLMEISEPTPFEAAVRDSPAGGLRLIALPTATNPLPQVASHLHTIIGPEGGFTADELALAEQLSWQPVSLGNRILRIETAAVAVASCVSVASGHVRLAGNATGGCSEPA